MPALIASGQAATTAARSGGKEAAKASEAGRLMPQGDRLDDGLMLDSMLADQRGKAPATS
jgi:hypothetical protein